MAAVTKDSSTDVVFMVVEVHGSNGTSAAGLLQTMELYAGVSSRRHGRDVLMEMKVQNILASRGHKAEMTERTDSDEYTR